MQSENKCLWIVNQFAGTPVSGWGERHFYLSKQLKKRGYRVVIISSGKNHMFNRKIKMNGLFTYENYDGIEFCWVNTPNYNPKSFTRFIAMFCFALTLILLPFKTNKFGKPNYLLLSSMSIFPAPVVYFLKKYFKAKKFILEIRDLWPLTPIHLMGYSPNHPFIRIIGWFEKYAYRKADKIVSLLKESKSHISSISKMPSKFEYIPNGISEELLEQNNYNTELYNYIKNAIPQDSFVIGYTGTLGFANALDPFFEFIAEQPKELKERLFFIIAGDGYLMETYQSKVKHCKNILFLGKIPKKNVQTVISLVDLCFISWHHSRLYEYGVSANKYFDYLAAKKPVLSAQTGIVDPIILSGCGRVVKNDKTEIENAVKCFLNLTANERKNLGDKGFNYVMQNHLYSKLGNDYANLLEE